MVSRSFALTLAMVLYFAASASAQFKSGSSEEQKTGQSAVQMWQAGVVIKAAGGPCKGLVATIPIPMDWPEQDVKVAKEEISTHVRTSEKTFDGVKQMVFTVATLPANEEAKAIITFEITRRVLLPPKDTAAFVIPEAKDLDRLVRPCLKPSPKIDCTNSRIVSAAKEVIAEKKTAWEQVEALYDYTREKVKADEMVVPRGAVTTLQEGSAGHEDQTRVFIALCRAAGVPARTVWIDKFCYAEFYLCDGQGKGRWFPCMVAGNRSFGGIDDLRPILEKGDNFRSPDWRKTREHVPYMFEVLTGSGGQPQYDFIRQMAESK